MHIDIISDTVCPWCYIGKRRLERAMAMRPDLDFHITWRAYQLNPEMPPEGKDRREHYQAKFGSPEKTAQITKTIADVGREDDLNLAFEKIERMPNTLASHRLARWAASAGCQDDVVEGLFRAYFTEGRDVGDTEVLIEIAENAGMDTDLVRNLLSSNADEKLIKEEDQLARQMGINGVPCFIFDQKYPLVGAQEPEAFLQIFETVERAEADAESSPSSD